MQLSSRLPRCQHGVLRNLQLWPRVPVQAWMETSLPCQRPHNPYRQSLHILRLRRLNSRHCTLSQQHAHPKGRRRLPRPQRQPQLQPVQRRPKQTLKITKLHQPKPHQLRQNELRGFCSPHRRELSQPFIGAQVWTVASMHGLGKPFTLSATLRGVLMALLLK